MKRDYLINVYMEDNVVIVRNCKNGNEIQIEAAFDELTIQNCIYLLEKSVN